MMSPAGMTVRLLDGDQQLARPTVVQAAGRAIEGGKRVPAKTGSRPEGASVSRHGQPAGGKVVHEVGAASDQDASTTRESLLAYP